MNNKNTGIDGLYVLNINVIGYENDFCIVLTLLKGMGSEIFSWKCYTDLYTNK